MLADQNPSSQFSIQPDNASFALSIKEIESDPWNERIQTASIFTVIAAIGVLINSLPIYLTATTKLRQNNVNILVAHLSVADLIVCLIFAVGQNFYIIYRNKLPPIGCQWLGFINSSCGFQVFIFPAVLSLNRYVSLYHSAYYERIYTLRNVWLMIIGTWIFVCTILLTFTLTGHTGWDQDNQHCCIVIKGEVFWIVYFWIVCMGPIVGVGDVVVLFCNWKIYKKLTNHAAAQQMAKSVISQHRELLYFLIIEMIVPICFHSTYLLAKFAYLNRSQLWWKQFFSILYLINSTTRSVVMLSMLRPLRTEFLRVFCRRRVDEVRSRKSQIEKSVVKVISTKTTKTVTVHPLITVS